METKAIAAGAGLAVFIGLGIVLGYSMRRRDPPPPEIVRDSPRPTVAPSPSVAPKPSTPPEPAPPGIWLEDTEVYAWPPVPPRRHEMLRVDATHFMLDKEFVHDMVEHQATMMKSARIIPEYAGGKIIGVKVLGLRPASLLARLGFENGDRLEAMNGMLLANPDHALEAYTHFKTATRVFVSLTRTGAPLVIHYLITTSTVPGDAGLSPPKK